MSSATAEKIPQHLIEQAKRANLLSLAERHSELRREGAGEYAGPCPKCGGSDRFHVNEREGWWFCRQCHTKRGDGIELLRWLTPGLSFAEAVAQLTGSGVLSASSPATRRQPQRRPPAAQPADWRKSTEALVAAAHERLWGHQGEAARAYLESRGLHSGTWLTYGLGFRTDAPLPGTSGKQRAPAIVLPWRSKTLGVYAVRYRFLSEQRYTDLDGKERAEKLVAETGSQFAGRLFGGQALPEFVFMPVSEGQQTAEALRWLLVIEGEINCMSCHQVAHETGLDVMSLGSESAHLSPVAVQFAQRYGRVLVWADKGKIAQQLMQALPGAYGIRSPGGQDANDLLRAGKLGGFLALARADAAKNAQELERLLWALWDGADTLAGLDSGSAQVAMSLAERLGKQVRLVEVEPERWVTTESIERVWQPAAPGPEPERQQPAKPPLPESMWASGIATYEDAWELWRLATRQPAAVGLSDGEAAALWQQEAQRA